MTLITALFIALALFGIYYVAVLTRGVRAARAAGENTTPTPLGIGTGALTNFLDNLGGRLGSFDRLEKELPEGATWSGYDRALGGAAHFAARAAEPEDAAAAAA